MDEFEKADVVMEFRKSSLKAADGIGGMASAAGQFGDHQKEGAALAEELMRMVNGLKESETKFIAMVKANASA